jgi:agmatinase
MESFDTDYPHFLGSETEQGDGQSACFHVIPVPYEKTVSYGGGTAKGPAAILQASWQLETWDGHSTPCELGIHSADPVDCGADAAVVLERIAAAVCNAVKRGGRPVVLGGEHAVTHGVIRGLLDAGIADFGVVQIDAHADLRDAYEGDPLSHASVMRRIADLDIPVFQLGVRACCEEEIQARRNCNVHYMDAEELVTGNIQQLTLPDSFPPKVFFTLDIDGMDPSVFPSTGTPVPGGLGWYQTLSLFESVAGQREIIGFDVVEFAPIPGFHAYDFAAAQLVYKLMGIIQRNNPGA